MAVRVKADGDLPTDVVTLLRSRGYEADGVLDERMGGWKDSALWSAVQADGRFLVTADKGFANIVRHPPGTHAGILLLRPDEDGIPPVIGPLADVLDLYRLDSLSGCVAVASPRRVRVRRPGQG